MTARQKRIVRESFPKIAEVRGPLSVLFYGRLFQTDPRVRFMFHGDIAVQGRKLMDMVTAVVGSLDQLDKLDPLLQALGQRHVGYGVRPEHYQLVAQSFLWALGQALEGDFDRECRDAWSAVIGAVAERMLEGAGALDVSPNPQA